MSRWATRRGTRDISFRCRGMTHVIIKQTHGRLQIFVLCAWCQPEGQTLLLDINRRGDVRFFMHGKNVGMSMRHIRAGEDKGHALYPIGGLHGLAKALPQMHDRGSHFRRQVVVVVIVRFGNDENMAGAYWVYVQKSLELLIFVDHMSRNLTCSYAAENTVLMRGFPA